MVTIFSHPYSDFSGNTGRFTISTGPVIINRTGDKILLHISSSTGKYQFIGGRLDDDFSFRENALMRAKEVVGNNTVTLTDDNPTILIDTITRDNNPEQILLIHYKAHIENETNVGDAIGLLFLRLRNYITMTKLLAQISLLLVSIFSQNKFTRIIKLKLYE